MAYLLDTNVLLRLFTAADPRHAAVQAAVDALRARGETVHLAPQNAAEVWNVATRPADKNGFGYTPADADVLLGLVEEIAEMLPDHPDAYAHWRRLVRDAGVSGVQVHDARLVGWMLAHGVTHLLTLNAEDFRRYKGHAPVTVVEPSEVLA